MSKFKDLAIAIDEGRIASKPIYMTAIYVVPSETHPGTAYDVEVDPQGTWYCTCPSYAHRGQHMMVPTCKHIQRKQNEIITHELRERFKAPAPSTSGKHLTTELERLFGG